MIIISFIEGYFMKNLIYKIIDHIDAGIIQNHMYLLYNLKEKIMSSDELWQQQLEEQFEQDMYDAESEHFSTFEEESIEKILKERQSQHGNFSDNAKLSQLLKMMVRGNEFQWNNLEFEQQEGIDNILQKISRLITGGGNHVDTVVDIQGYARLMEKEMNERN